jgi:hypothetical protein
LERRRSSFLHSARLFGIALCALLFSHAASAADACVPPPAGVVGLPGPPDWTGGGTPEVDDPRWHGASGEAFPDLIAGGSAAARSRLVQDSGSLFFQMRILADAAPGNTVAPTGTTFYRDSVYVAFADAALATIQVVRVAVDNTGATHATRWLKSGGTWTSGPAAAGAPAWLGGFTAWVNPPINGLATTQNWAVNFKVATASMPGTKFWYATVISPSGIGAVQTYAWPNRGGFVEPNPPDTGLTAATWGAQFDAIGSANWGNYTSTTGTLPLSAGCQGIRIESNDIGTTNAIPWKINTNADNTFQVKLTTTGGAAMPAAGTVKARFRVAGVGGDWYDIAEGSCVGGCTNGQSGNPTNIIQFSCPFTGPGSCPPHSATAPDDQCMLVELSPALGSMTFSQDSAVACLGGAAGGAGGAAGAGGEDGLGAAGQPDIGGMAIGGVATGGTSNGATTGGSSGDDASLGAGAPPAGMPAGGDGATPASPTNNHDSDCGCRAVGSNRSSGFAGGLAWLLAAFPLLMFGLRRRNTR